MAMQSVRIEVPESLRDFVESQVAGGEYGSASEYLEALIRADRKARGALAPYTTGVSVESLVLEGLASGDAGAMTRDDWNALRRPFQQRHDASGEG